MSILVKVVKIKFDNQDLYCVLDMKAITLFKKLTNSSFLQEIKRLKDMDETVILNLLACTIRETPQGDPLGIEFLEKYNPISLITRFAPTVAELVKDSLPEATPTPNSNYKKKKKKR